jgi:hypothetical protein
MLIGAHCVIHSKDPEKDRAFLRDVLKLPSVDAGGGYVIFGLPPAEVSVHEHEGSALYELYLMCADMEPFVGEMKSRHLVCDPVHDEGWGLLTSVRLPSGSKLGVYQPRHARPGG